MILSQEKGQFPGLGISYIMHLSFPNVDYREIMLSSYDPSLTYGRVKQPALPAVIPHWVHYDKRCLNFTAFFKQPVYENPDENFRVRVVNIVYFLEDDTLTVMEPRVKVTS